MSTIATPSARTEYVGGRSTALLGNTVAVAVVAALLLAVPYLTGANAVSLVTEALILALAATSLNVLAGETGLISLGHAATFGGSAYILAIAQRDLDVGFIVAAIVAVLGALLLSFVFAITASRSSGVYFILVTMAQGMLVWGIVQRWSDFTGGDDGIGGIERPTGLSQYWAYYWFVVVVVAVCIVGLYALHRSSFGLRLRGVRDTGTRMSALGYDVERQRLKSFLVAGFFAGIAGSLYAGNYQFVSPGAVHMGMSVDLLLMVVIGGIGVFYGPVFGAVVYVLLQAVLSEHLERWATVMGATLILMVLFAPDGVLGRLQGVLKSFRSQRGVR